MLSLSNVSLSIAEKNILKDVSITIEPAKLTVLVGPNGAGKSTALKVLSGDYQGTTGQVSLNGKALSSYSSPELAKLRSVMTQGYEMSFPFSVREVVDMANYPFTDTLSKQQKQQNIRDAVLLAKVDHLVDKPYPQLSGGEQQRVQLARVLTQLFPAIDAIEKNQHNAPYLLIDEPTSSLDLYHQHHVMAIAQMMARKGAGVVAVIHDLALAAAFADKIYVIGEGKIAAEGPPELALTSEIIEAIYKVDAQLAFSENALPQLVVAKTNDCLDVTRPR